MKQLVKTSYKKEDVIVLLQDLSSQMKEMSTEEREKAIQSGIHYSEMLPQEKEPSKEYKTLYDKALEDNKLEIAKHIAILSEIILKNTNGNIPVLISLARAGLPVGILVKRYLKQKHNIDCSHYSISIIRGKGIDVNAMEDIYKKEVEENGNDVENFFFVDGWTGKGAIKTQLEEAVLDLRFPNGFTEDEIPCKSKWANLSDDLYVLADPANITPYCGTHLDYLLPSACFNSTVSGLISRTILNKLVDVENGDYHGAVYFDKFEAIDCSNDFIDCISNEFVNILDVDSTIFELNKDLNGMNIVTDICTLLDIKDFKKVKPGIGETTRVLLRRMPWKILINKDISDTDPDIQHILMLCQEKNIPIMRWDLGNYKVCGIIKELADA